MCRDTVCRNSPPVGGVSRPDGSETQPTKITHFTHEIVGARFPRPSGWETPRLRQFIGSLFHWGVGFRCRSTQPTTTRLFSGFPVFSFSPFVYIRVDSWMVCSFHVSRITHLSPLWGFGIICLSRVLYTFRPSGAVLGFAVALPNLRVLSSSGFLVLPFSRLPVFGSVCQKTVDKSAAP